MADAALAAARKRAISARKHQYTHVFSLPKLTDAQFEHWEPFLLERDIVPNVLSQLMLQNGKTNAYSLSTEVFKYTLIRVPLPTLGYLASRAGHCINLEAKNEFYKLYTETVKTHLTENEIVYNGEGVIAVVEYVQSLVGIKRFHEAGVTTDNGIGSMDGVTC